MILHTYWRSSAAYRVRIALSLKGVECDSAFVHLVRDGGEQLAAPYAALNPQKLVPALEVDEGEVLTQSLAIVEYLEETHPAPPLLPSGAGARARVRAIAQAVACEIHPLNNLRVLRYLTAVLGVGDEARRAWYGHWVALGFEAVEQMLAGSGETGVFCHGDVPTIADICLVPQVYNARRFDIDLEPYPIIRRIDAACASLDAFASAAPDVQADAGVA